MRRTLIYCNSLSSAASLGNLECLFVFRDHVLVVRAPAVHPGRRRRRACSEGPLCLLLALPANANIFLHALDELIRDPAWTALVLVLRKIKWFAKVGPKLFDVSTLDGGTRSCFQFNSLLIHNPRSLLFRLSLRFIGFDLKELFVWITRSNSYFRHH